MTNDETEEIQASFEETRSSLQNFKDIFGFAPAMFRVLANSPAAFQASCDLQGSLASVLDNQTRRRISLAVSQTTKTAWCR